MFGEIDLGEKNMEHAPWSKFDGPCSTDHGPWPMGSMDHGPRSMAMAMAKLESKIPSNESAQKHVWEIVFD